MNLGEIRAVQGKYKKQTQNFIWLAVYPIELCLINSKAIMVLIILYLIIFY